MVGAAFVADDVSVRRNDTLCVAVVLTDNVSTRETAAIGDRDTCAEFDSESETDDERDTRGDALVTPHDV